MRHALLGLGLACAIVSHAIESPARAAGFDSPNAVMQWTFDYRERPEPGRLDEAVAAMLGHSLLGEDDKSGYFVGFIAGVLAQNPDRAGTLIEAMLPLPPKEQAVLVRAIGYSRLPDWPALMARFSPDMPDRELLIGDFLVGEEPELFARSWDDGPVVIYTLWGFYVATGERWPIRRVISALALAGEEGGSAFSLGYLARSVGLEGDGDKQTRLSNRTVAATAKWTLAAYAEHDRELIDYYRDDLAVTPPALAGQLADVLAAAERFDADRIRVEESEAVEAMRQRLARIGPANTRAAHAGSVGLATACVIAGALGHIEIAGTCVVTGALYSGAMKLFGW